MADLVGNRGEFLSEEINASVQFGVSVDGGLDLASPLVNHGSVIALSHQMRLGDQLGVERVLVFLAGSLRGGADIEVFQAAAQVLQGALRDCRSDGNRDIIEAI